MKKNIFASFATLFLIALISINVSAASPTAIKDEPSKVIEKEKVESAEAKVILERLDEIKAMDKSKMTSKEKRQLRKEVRALRTQMAQIGGGIYISAGALIVILLLILLL